MDKKSCHFHTPPSTRASPDSWKAMENSDPGVIPFHHSIRVEQQPVSAVWRTRLNLLGTFFSSLKGSRVSPNLLVQPRGCSRSVGAERDAIGKKGRFLIPRQARTIPSKFTLADNEL